MPDSPNRPAAIVFDFGGVLIDWNPRYLYRKLLPDDDAIERFLAEIGFAAWNLEQDRSRRPFAEAAAELGARFPHHAALIEAFHLRWPETLAGPVADTVAVLHELKQAGERLYGLTNWSSEKFAPVRAQYSFFGWFDDIVVSGEVGLVKPEPAIYTLLLERIGLPAAQCLFIDDVVKNLEPARALGFQIHHFRSPALLRKTLRQLDVLR